MSNFTLTDSQIALLRAAAALITIVAEELPPSNIVSIDVQNGAGPGVNTGVKVITFEGGDDGRSCDDGQIIDGDFTIELRHFHDGKSQYIDLPNLDEANKGRCAKTPEGCEFTDPAKEATP